MNFRFSFSIQISNQTFLRQIWKTPKKILIFFSFPFLKLFVNILWENDRLFSSKLLNKLLFKRFKLKHVLKCSLRDGRNLFRFRLNWQLTPFWISPEAIYSSGHIHLDTRLRKRTHCIPKLFPHNDQQWCRNRRIVPGLGHRKRIESTNRWSETYD